MNRRELLLAGTALAGASMLPTAAFAEANRIDWYTGSDQNILDFWTNIVKPKFEAANPGITLNLVDAGDNTGLQTSACSSAATTSACSASSAPSSIAMPRPRTWCRRAT